MVAALSRVQRFGKAGRAETSTDSAPFSPWQVPHSSTPPVVFAAAWSAAAPLEWQLRQVAVTGIGLSAVSGKSRGMGMAVAFGLWLVYVLIASYLGWGAR